MDRSTLRRVASWPTFHFAILGGLLFAASPWREPATDAPVDRPRLEIAASRVAEAEQAFRGERRRPPTATERAELLDALVDEEVLFRHALALGLHEAEVPRRRLALIASFVEPASSSAGSEVLARRAVDLGLHEGDFVTRRVLIDAARRLVRGAARLVEPSDEAVVDYLREHGERFREEDRFRVTHVLASRARSEDPAEAAVALVDRLRRDDIVPDDAAAYGDASIVPPSLPLLGVRALERRFGTDFTRRLAALPVGEWTGPVVSRHGAHAVFVHERRPGRVPEPAEVGDRIRALLREEAADRWLAERLRQLRAGYTIVIGPGREDGEVTS